MLQIKCDDCGEDFIVDGFTTFDSNLELGEVITELQSSDPLCDCLVSGGGFSIVDEWHDDYNT